MAKTLEEFRAQNLRLLEQISSEDPDYVEKWMQQFDKQHGIKKTGLSLRAMRDSASASKAGPRSRRR